MREINFFEYIMPDKKINKRSFFLFTTVFLICSFFIFYAIFNVIRIRTIEKEVAVLSHANESIEAIQRISIIEQKREQMINVEDTYNTFKKHYDKINEKSSIGYTLFNSIVSASPQNLFFKNIKVEKQTINIDVFAIAQNSLTEFENNLTSIDNLRVGSISNIIMNPGHYYFTIVISIEE
ncbi:MAG: PilN domain-containing protein [Alkaliphilus sp.]